MIRSDFIFYVIPTVLLAFTLFSLIALRGSLVPIPFDDYPRCDTFSSDRVDYYEYIVGQDGVVNLLLSPEKDCQCEKSIDCSRVKLKWIDFKWGWSALDKILRTFEASSSIYDTTDCNYELQFHQTGSITSCFQLRPMSTCGYTDDSVDIMLAMGELFRNRLLDEKMPVASCVIIGRAGGPMYYFVYGTNILTVKNLECEEYMSVRQCNEK
ncbi:hypothetical protein DICA4_D17546 [Diutina catenulata]